MNIPPFGSLHRKTSNLDEFRVRALDVPNNRVHINAGSFWPDKTDFAGFFGGPSPVFTFPTTANTSKFVIVCLDKAARPVLVDGVESTSQAEIPVIPANLMPLAGVYVKNTTTVITESMIHDLRPFLNFNFGVNEHSQLINLNSTDAHPISSITGLSDALLNKVNTTELATAVSTLNNTLDSALQSKSDSNGTTSETFTLHKNVTGVPASDCMIKVERGSLPDVFIRWNEANNYWEYTNDGSTWHSFDSNLSVVNATDNDLGVVKLSVGPIDNNNPISVGDNDPRLLTEQEKLDLLNSASSAVTSVNSQTGVVNLTKTDVGLSDVDNTSDADKPISTLTQLALDDKVDNVVGKQLSTEDFTSEEKLKLIDIEDNAQVNTVASVNSQTGVVNLTKTDVGLSDVDNTSDADKPISTLTQLALDDKADTLLLDNVDNTSDADKPISTLTQTALDTKLNAIVEDKSVSGSFYRIEVNNGLLVVTLVV